MITSRLFCLAVAILLAMPRPMSAAEPLSFGVLTAPPYGLEREDKSVGGSNHDIAALIAEKAGLTFTYRLEPLPRLVNDLKAGKLDLMMMFPTAETKSFAIAEIMPNSTIILPHAGNAFRQFADLKGRTIGGLRGAVYDQQFAAEAEIKKFDVDSYRMGLQMAQSGRIDGMIGPDFGLYYQMKLEGMTRDQFAPAMMLNTRMLYLLGSNSITPELAAKLRTAVEHLRNSGAISAVAAKYAD